MMFEELFSRRRQTRTTERQLPKEIDAVQRAKGGKSRGHHSSMSVDGFIWTKRVVVGGILLIGLGIIGLEAYSLISDYISYSAGEPASSYLQSDAAVPGE